MSSEDATEKLKTTYAIFRTSPKSDDKATHRELLKRIKTQYDILEKSAESGDREKLEHLKSFLGGFGVFDLDKAIDSLK